jgi:hypothetical protein
MLNAKRIYLDTLANGGSSTNLDNDSPQIGYMVALPGRELVVKPDWFSTTTVQEYVDNNITDLEDTNNYVGTWLDTNTDTIYLDVSVNVVNLYKAIQLGHKYHQLAIYDVVKQDTITL